MNRAIHVALVRYGPAGRVSHAPVIGCVPGFRLAMVHSSKVNALVEEALADPQIDLEVVATPERTHYELARRALEAGKHAAQALRLMELLERREVALGG